MRTLKVTTEYAVDTEEEALAFIQTAQKESMNPQNEPAFSISSSGYAQKEKKAKGEVIAEQFIIKITRVFDTVWSNI